VEPPSDQLGTVAAPLAGRAAVRPSRATGDDFSRAVADHHRELARFAFRLCGDRTEAEDIVAEAYARVWPYWRRGRVDSLVPYLMRTVANLAFAGHRRRRLENRSDAPPALVIEDRVVERFEDRVDVRDQLWSALARLPRQQRVVLVLRVVEDLSEDATAAILGIPSGTVKSRLSRALDALRSTMEGSRG